MKLKTINSLLRGGVAALAAAVAAGLVVGVGGTASATGTDLAYAKLEDNSSEWLVAADDSDDEDDDEDGDDANTDTGAGTTTGPDTNTDTGIDSDDATGSRVTAVSEDRDESFDDITKDWTLDGGDRTRDFSQNMTNDASANDTR